jgi:hypothetical protein
MLKITATTAKGIQNPREVTPQPKARAAAKRVQRKRGAPVNPRIKTIRIEAARV